MLYSSVSFIHLFILLLWFRPQVLDQTSKEQRETPADCLTCSYRYRDKVFLKTQWRKLQNSVSFRKIGKTNVFFKEQKSLTVLNVKRSLGNNPKWIKCFKTFKYPQSKFYLYIYQTIYISFNYLTINNEKHEWKTI